MTQEKTMAQLLDEIESDLYGCRTRLKELLAVANERGMDGCLVRHLDDALGQAGDGADQLALAQDEYERELRAELVAVPDETTRPHISVLSVETPMGTLAAHYRGDPGIYDGIEVELRKPDGTVGTVCLAEVVSGEGAEGYPTRVHTLAFDGRDEEPASRTDLDIDGEEMDYPALAPARCPARHPADSLEKEAGAGGIDLEAESKDARAASHELDGAAKHRESGAR